MLQTKQNSNLSAFNIITGINESKTLTNHILCECKCNFDGRKWNSNQNWNNEKCWCDRATKTVPTNFNEEKVALRIKNLCNFLAFLLIVITLFIAVSIYYYLIKYQAK